VRESGEGDIKFAAQGLQGRKYFLMALYHQRAGVVGAHGKREEERGRCALLRRIRVTSRAKRVTWPGVKKRPTRFTGARVCLVC
jgi:hypothetical protein